MKYYAVTDDPTELMHYGIKGMKWGVIRTDAQLGHPKKPKITKPRSPAYMKASSKLSSAMKRGIAKAQTKWKVYNSPASKAERKFEKHVQLARQGRLKYKGISDSEVQRITDRLMLENRARQQSGNEKQSFRRRLTESVSEGIIRGAGQGTSSYINERMTARGRTTGKIKEAKRLAAYKNSLQGRLAQNRENRAKEREVTAQARRDFDKEYYKMLIDEGESIHGRGREKALAIAKGTGHAIVRAANGGASNADVVGDYRNAFANAHATRSSRARRLAEYRAKTKNSGASSNVIRETNQEPSSNVHQTSSSIIRPSYVLKRSAKNYAGVSKYNDPFAMYVRSHPNYVRRSRGRR